MVLGITGKIGVGKSTVSKIFASKGWVIIDADKIGNFVASTNPKVIKALAKEFGADILTPNGKLKRKVLRKKAFKNKKTTQQLNNIVHPFLIAELLNQLKNYVKQDKNVIVDAALLHDWKFGKHIDVVLLVHSNMTLRMQRMRNRGFDKNLMLEIDKQQKSFQYLRTKSDYLIYNSGTEKKLQEKVVRLIAKLDK